MKILLLTERMEAGGAETHVEQLARGLLRQGHTVAVLSEGGAIADRLERAGVRQYRVPTSPHTWMRFWRLRRMLVRLIKREGYDVLHAHARFPALLLRGMQRLGARTVVTVHAAFAHNRRLSHVCYWGEKTVAISEDLRLYVTDHYPVPATQVSVIRNGVDTVRFSPTGEAWEERRGRIAFLSRLDEDCALGAELLCRAALPLSRAFLHLHVTILGRGTAYARLRARSEEINRTAGRELVCVSDDVGHLPRVLGKSAILVGVSRAAMEGAACGCAVVLCGNEGYAGILSPENADEAEASNLSARGETAASAFLLERDLCALLGNEEACRELGDFARRLVCERFSAEEMCAETQGVYRRLLSCSPVRREPLVRRVLVGGYAGCGNLGDDAMLLGLIEGFSRLAPTTELTALTRAPRRSRRRFGILTVGRMRPFAIASAMCRHDAFLSGGGTLLQNQTANRSLCYYLFLLRLASRYGCRTALISSGIGPLRGERAKKRTAETLAATDRCFLREENARRTLLRLGIPADRLSVGADAGFLLSPPPHARTLALLRAQRIAPGTRLLFVAPRPTIPAQETVLLSAIRHLTRTHGFLPLFAAFDEREDTLVAKRGAVACGGLFLPLREPTEAMAWLRACELSLTMRLHAMLFATAVGVPAIAVTAEEKLTVLAHTLGQACLPVDDLGVASLVETAEREWRARDRSRHRLLQAAKEQQKNAWKDLAKVVDLIYNKRDDSTNETEGSLL